MKTSLNFEILVMQPANINSPYSDRYVNLELRQCALMDTGTYQCPTAVDESGNPTNFSDCDPMTCGESDQLSVKRRHSLKLHNFGT